MRELPLPNRITAVVGDVNPILMVGISRWNHRSMSDGLTKQKRSLFYRNLTEVCRVFLSVFHLEVEIQVVTLETTGNLHSSSLLAVQTAY